MNVLLNFQKKKIYISAKNATYCTLAIKNMNGFGKKIEERRTKLGISQQDLSEISGVSLRTINSIENDSCNPSIETLQKILDPLGYVITLAERVDNG